MKNTLQTFASTIRGLTDSELQSYAVLGQRLNIARDGQLLQYVREVASRVVDEDPTCIRPENAVLWQQLQALRKTNINWAAIS